MTDMDGRSGRREDEPRRFGGRDLRGCRLPRCQGCGLPELRCLCAALPRVRAATRIVVVSHRVEALRSTNTARLVARMVDSATMVLRGEGAEELPVGRRLVLFPFEHARPLQREDGAEPLTLVVPDGTWSQARRIARRDALAREVEAVTVPARESAYALRRNPRQGALCTVEAVAEALRVLEGDAIADTILGGFVRWRDASLSLRTAQRGRSP